MRKALLTLAVAGSVLSLAAPANAQQGTEVFAAGASNGSRGFTMAVYATSALTDPNNHHITHYCNFSIDGAGNDVVITIAANANSGAHAVAVSTGIYCDVRDRNGTIVHAAALALPGTSASVVSPSGLVRNNGPYRVCSQGTGQWSDTHLFSTPLRCQDPSLPI